MSEVRLIDANALKKALTYAHINMELTFDIATFNCVMNTIDKAPTVPQADFKEGYKQAIIDGKTNFSKPEGEWIDHSEDYAYAECPFCHELTNCESNIDELHYCWNCGAKLGKGGTE